MTPVKALEPFLLYGYGDPQVVSTDDVGETRGFMKAIVDRETHHILGAVTSVVRWTSHHKEASSQTKIAYSCYARRVFTRLTLRYRVIIE
jgi:hypothetical protein